MEKISDLDPRIVYFPEDAAPDDCASTPTDDDCSSHWYAFHALQPYTAL